MLILDAFNRNIRQTISPAPRPFDNRAHASLQRYTDALTLVKLSGERHTPCADTINGRTVRLDENPMGIRWIRFAFDGNTGRMEYENATGAKALPFGLRETVLSEFPEEGYPDMEIRDFTSGSFYPCATDAAWQDARTLAIRCFMIGKHLGALYITVGFREDGTVGLRMLRNTNCFLATYNGYATGRLE